MTTKNIDNQDKQGNERNEITGSQITYNEFSIFFKKLCDFDKKHPGCLSRDYSKFNIRLGLLNDESLSDLSKIDMKKIILLERTQFYDEKYNLKDFFDFKDTDCIEIRFLSAIFKYILCSEKSIIENKHLLTEYIIRNGLSDFHKCFKSTNGMINALIDLKLPDDKAFDCLHERVILDKKCRINCWGIENLNKVSEERLFELYSKNKDLFVFEEFSHKRFILFVDGIKSNDCRSTYTKEFILSKLKYDENLSYVKKMLNRLTDDHKYEVSKEMLAYCKSKGIDYHSYEKEVIKYELKLSTLENKKTKKRL